MRFGVGSPSQSMLSAVVDRVKLPNHIAFSASLNTDRVSVECSQTPLSWKPTGERQQTLADCVELKGKGLHSGKFSRVKLLPEVGGKGRNFFFGSGFIPASINFVEESPLCTTLCKDGYKIRTVEHLLSALEAKGVDNCKIQIESADYEDREIEVPVLDGSAKEWVSAIEDVGLKVALNDGGKSVEKKAVYVNEPVQVWRQDSFVVAFPSSEVQTTCGIDFPHAPAIGCQWFSSALFRDSLYSKQIASARTFCIFEEIEQMQKAGLAKGGSFDNAIVCSSQNGWLNPPLRFEDEPCRHKMLDLIGDLSLLAQGGNGGLLVAHIVAFKGGHALHAEFVRHVAGIASWNGV